MIWINHQHLGAVHPGFPPVREILSPEGHSELNGFVLLISEDDLLIGHETISIKPTVWDKYRLEMVFEFIKADQNGNILRRRYTEQEMTELYKETPESGR